MAIYGIGATYGDDDVSGDFIANNLIGVGWDTTDAPELSEYIKSLKVGDIVYIKTASFSSDITVKGIGIIRDNVIRDRTNSNRLVSTGRNILWLDTEHFVISKPTEKNNVRANTIYEEFHPEVQQIILGRIENT